MQTLRKKLHIWLHQTHVLKGQHPSSTIETDVHAICKRDENQSKKIGKFTKRCSKNENLT